MCKAKHYSEQLQEIFENINKEFTILCEELSQSDKYQEDILHKIEQGGFNAAEGYKLAKMIQDNRLKRRQIKNELAPLKELKDNFVNSNIKNLINTHDKIVSIDCKLSSLTEQKIYMPKVVDVTTELKLVNRSTKKETMKHKKNGKEIVELKKADGELYYGKFKDGNKNLVNIKDILNFDASKIV